MTIRPAEPRDAEAIGGVHRAAFPTPAEADLIEALTREGDATVSLVAERQGEVVDHVLLSRMRVSGDGRARRAVGLGPVGVRPAFRAAASARA